jgi:hypothetical protein
MVELNLLTMSDYVFEKVLVKNALPHLRDGDTWERLLSPALIRRTHSTLVRVKGRHLASVRARKQAWKECANDRETRFTSTKEFSNASCAYTEQRRRDSQFTSVIQEALIEVNVEFKRRNQETNRDQQGVYRLVIGELVRAIQHHRDICVDADVIPEDVDEELWNVLDTVLAPDGDEWVSVREFESMPSIAYDNVG